MIQNYVKFISLVIMTSCYAARTMQVSELPKGWRKKSIFKPLCKVKKTKQTSAPTLVAGTAGAVTKNAPLPRKKSK